MAAKGLARNQRDEEYFAALGRFISEFAMIEAIMAYRLHREAGVKSPVAEALFSGVRVDQAKSLITRAIEAKGGSVDPLLKRAFEQLTLITNARNAVVHYADMVADDDGSLWITNILAAHKPSRVQMTLVSADALYRMTADLGMIAGVIMGPLIEDMISSDSEGKIAIRRRKSEPPSPFAALIAGAAQVPFAYKPAQPTPSLKQSRTKHLAPRRPRQPSRPKPQEPPPPKREK